MIGICADGEKSRLEIIVTIKYSYKLGVEQT